MSRQAESTNGQEAIRLQEVVKIYAKPGGGIAVHALRGVNAVFHKGEYTAVVGVSGCGKSTMMNIIGCLDRPTSGTYILDGRDVSNLSDDELSEVRGKHIGFVFQNFNLIGAQTVLENLEVPMYYQGLRPAERRDRAIRMAERVGLADRLHHLPSELSGGQQQRVAIARAMMNEPVLLLADEPTGNLDSQTGQSILDMLDELNRSGMTIITVTHEANVAGRCKRVLEMRDGLIVQ